MGRPAEVVETHTAIVFFVGDHVYKLKKPVDLGFLDHRSREARRASCQREVDLNRRLAPDVYLGVIDLVGDDGEPIDHLVDMRRMPSDRRLALCIERAEDVEPAVRAIARSVAALHAGSPSDPTHDALATRAAVAQRWTEGFDQLRTLSTSPHLADQLAAMERLAARYLAGRDGLFAQRIADGWIRDGHGDLQAEDIFVLDDGPRVLDCIEFGEQYRWGDVLADAAFLAMDLERLGRADLAQLFLDLHRELVADRWPATLAHHYIAYRAHVRAKVGIVRASQVGAEPAAGVDAYVSLSLRHLEAAQVQMVLVGGSPGTGKSTLAAGLGDRLGAVVLRTDEVRERVSPVDGADRYSAESVAATYRELLVEAKRLVGLGEHVILDATWSDAAERDRARALGREASCDVVELRCTLPAAAAAARVRARQARGDDPSEATPQVAAAIASRFDPWPQAREIPTADPPDAVADRAARLLASNRSGGPARPR